MTSCKERREVAERLRERPVARNIKEAYVAIVQAVGVRPCLLSHEGESGDRFDAAAYADALDRLADLIDPTCHIADDDWASRQCMGPMLSCDRCGNAFPEINGPYQYCPYCGARVVERGEADGRVHR